MRGTKHIHTCTCTHSQPEVPDGQNPLSVHYFKISGIASGVLVVSRGCKFPKSVRYCQLSVLRGPVLRGLTVVDSPGLPNAVEAMLYWTLRLFPAWYRLQSQFRVQTYHFPPLSFLIEDCPFGYPLVVLMHTTFSHTYSGVLVTEGGTGRHSDVSG